MYKIVIKRIVDIFLSLSSIIVLSPLMAVTAFAIIIEDGLPFIFKQKRIGKNGAVFTLYKFRSMPLNTGDIASNNAKHVRITTVGKIIRRTNIDELPQLVNILKGDMSIVGPRPPLPSQADLIELRRKNGALVCRPGLTGLAQISSYDGMTVAEKAALDGSYAASVSFINDMLTILKTFRYLLKPPPVY